MKKFCLLIRLICLFVGLWFFGTVKGQSADTIVEFDTLEVETVELIETDSVTASVSPDSLFDYDYIPTDSGTVAVPVKTFPFADSVKARGSPLPLIADRTPVLRPQNSGRILISRKTDTAPVPPAHVVPPCEGGNYERLKKRMLCLTET